MNTIRLRRPEASSGPPHHGSCRVLGFSSTAGAAAFGLVSRLSWRAIPGLLALGLLLLAKAVAQDTIRPSAKAATAALNTLLAAEWDETMAQNPTWASQLGDRRWNDRWEDVSLANYARQATHASNMLQRLNGISRDALPAGDRLNYDLYRYETELALEDFRYRRFLIALTQREGVQLLDELGDSLRFEAVKDYEDWLARLRALPTYVDQTGELLRAGIGERIVQPRVTMQRVPAQIQKQIVDAPDASPFYKPFTRFPADFPEADRARLTNAARTAIATGIVPAYRRFQQFFTNEYLPACFEREGAWQLPDGAATYAFLARKFTTTRMTPSEIHELGRREVKRIGDEMERVMRQTGFAGTRREFFQFLRSDPRFYCRTPEELLQAYRATAKRVDPELVRVFRNLPRAPYGVESIPDKVAPDTTAAYYRVLAADGSRAGSFFVNLYQPASRPKYEMMALTLHEAVPGHHLQFAVAFEQGGLPEFRRYGGERAYTAYIEGWALYAESLGDELGLYADPYDKFGQLTYEMWRAIRLVVDTGLHSLKWTRQEAIDYFLANAAKAELDVINEVDRYISWPGQALAYKVGELKIKELRARANRELGSHFDVKEFHDVVLRSGAVPLEVLERNVAEWIATVQKHP